LQARLVPSSMALLRGVAYIMALRSCVGDDDVQLCARPGREKALALIPKA